MLLKIKEKLHSCNNYLSLLVFLQIYIISFAICTYNQHRFEFQYIACKTEIYEAEAFMT